TNSTSALWTLLTSRTPYSSCFSKLSEIAQSLIALWFCGTTSGRVEAAAGVAETGLLCVCGVALGEGLAVVLVGGTACVALLAGEATREAPGSRPSISSTMSTIRREGSAT